MPPSNAMENDKKRLRNQFTKDERTRLLTIMTEYGPLLDDKNISILSRKEIWEIIENKFNENGHSGRTSAQLKKYWQNYKYHSKRTKIIHKEVPKPLSPMTKHMVRMLAKVNPEEWAQYDVAVNATSMKKSPASSTPSPTLTPPQGASSAISKRDRQPEVPLKIHTTPPQRSTKSSAIDASFSASDSRLRGESSSIIGAGCKSEISESNVVVSTTDVPGSSVTVSVICPEASSKARTIFWKRNNPQEKIGAMLQSNYTNESERANDFGPEIRSSDVFSEETDEPVGNGRSGKLLGLNNHGNRINVVGILPGNKSTGSDCCKKRSGRYHKLQITDDRPVQSVVLPRQKLSDNKSPRNKITARTDPASKSELIGNVIGVVKEIPTGSTCRSRDVDSVEIFLPNISTANRNVDTTKIPAGGSILNPFCNGQMISGVNGAANDDAAVGDKGDVDCSEFDEILRDFAAVKRSLKRTEILDDVKEMMETFDGLGKGRNLPVNSDGEKREVDVTRHAMNRDENLSRHDFLGLKLCLGLLRGGGQTGENRGSEILGKFEALISAMRLTRKRNDDNGESSDSNDARGESEGGMEIGEETNPDNGAGRLRVRRVSLMTPAVGGDEILTEIKAERETESGGGDAAENPALNDNTGDNRAMNSMNYLVQAKLQCAKSELDHQLKLQKLEMEEKQLRVRIAEMTIHETRLRIQALVEERLRATELHDLRLAQMAAEKVRSEAEHAARIDASCIAKAEGRARINSVERDRERSENLYQIQLRCMGANSASSANGNCAVKCKQYQH